jgi:hypothetical protein
LDQVGQDRAHNGAKLKPVCAEAEGMEGPLMG